MIFKYKAYDNLLLELGRNDYIVEIIEIAIKDFLAQVGNSSNPEQFIRNKCNQYGIMLSYDKSNNFYSQIILGHIANVYHYTETFLYEFQVEYNSFATTPWRFVEKLTKLQQTINFFKSKNRFNTTDNIESYLLETFEYYHQLRVYFSHKKTTSVGEINSKRNKAQSHFIINNGLLAKYRVTSMPKDLQDLDFEDFFLFTQISKELCLKISSICYPEPKGLSEIHEIKKIKKYSDKEVRKKRIEGYLKTNYGYLRENDSDKLADEIESYL